MEFIYLLQDKRVAVTRESLKKKFFCPLAQALLAFYSCYKNDASVCCHSPTSVQCLSLHYFGFRTSDCRHKRHTI